MTRQQALGWLLLAIAFVLSCLMDTGVNGSNDSNDSDDE